MNDNPSTHRNITPWYWLLAGLFLLWVLFVLASFYVVQNAFARPLVNFLPQMLLLAPTLSLTSLTDILVNIFIALWICFIALGSGRWILRRIFPYTTSDLDQIVLGIGLGYGVLGFLVLALGLFGLLDRWLILCFAIGLTLVTFRSSIRFLWNLRWPKMSTLIGLFVFMSFGLAFSLALLPPSSWDGLFYHLKGPQLYLEAGRIYPGIDIPHLNFPALMEMNFMLGMALRSDITAVLIHFSFALLLVGLVYLIARELFSVKNAWWAVLFLLATSFVLSLSSWAYNDLALAFYEVSALYALLQWRRKQMLVSNPKISAEQVTKTSEKYYDWLILAGLLAGLSMGFKYTSFVVPMTMVLLIIAWERLRLDVMVKAIILYSLVAFFVAAPWLIKNFIFTDNPVYPFVFGGEYWDEFRADAYRAPGTGIAFNPQECSSTPQNFLVGRDYQRCKFDPIYLSSRLFRLPYDLTMGLHDASRDGSPGPLFLIFLPLFLAYLLFIKTDEKPTSFNAVLFFALVQFAFWSLGVVFSAALFQSRLLLPAFVALCPLMAWVLEDLGRFDHPRFSLRGQMVLIVAVVLIAGLIIQVINWLPYQPWSYLSGTEDRSQYLTRILGDHYLAMEMINDKLPEGATVAFLWEPRSYYCKRDCRPDSILDTFGHWQYLYHGAGQIASELKSQGISHILIFQSGLNFVLDELGQNQPLSEPMVLTEFREEYLQLLDSIGKGSYLLYELR